MTGPFIDLQHSGHAASGSMTGRAGKMSEKQPQPSKLENEEARKWGGRLRSIQSMNLATLNVRGFTARKKHFEVSDVLFILK